MEKKNEVKLSIRALVPDPYLAKTLENTGRFLELLEKHLPLLFQAYNESKTKKNTDLNLEILLVYLNNYPDVKKSFDDIEYKKLISTIKHYANNNPIPILKYFANQFTRFMKNPDLKVIKNLRKSLENVKKATVKYEKTGLQTNVVVSLSSGNSECPPEIFNKDLPAGIPKVDQTPKPARNLPSNLERLQPLIDRIETICVNLEKNSKCIFSIGMGRKAKEIRKALEASKREIAKLDYGQIRYDNLCERFLNTRDRNHHRSLHEALNIHRISLTRGNGNSFFTNSQADSLYSVLKYVQNNSNKETDSPTPTSLRT